MPSATIAEVRQIEREQRLCHQRLLAAFGGHDIDAIKSLQIDLAKIVEQKQQLRSL